MTTVMQEVKINLHLQPIKYKNLTIKIRTYQSMPVMLNNGALLSQAEATTIQSND